MSPCPEGMERMRYLHGSGFPPSSEGLNRAGMKRRQSYAAFLIGVGVWGPPPCLQRPKGSYGGPNPAIRPAYPSSTRPLNISPALSRN